MPERVFNITPKTTNEWLKSHSSSSTQFKERVTADILKNGQEVGGNISWPAVFSSLRCVSLGKVYTGEKATYNSISTTVGCAVAQMGWNMHTPDVVYMSGLYYAICTEQRAKQAYDQAVKIETGSAKFTNEAAKERSLEENQNEVGLYGYTSSVLLGSLAEYVKQYKLGDETYLRVLRNLLFLGKLGIKNAARENLFWHIKSGQVAEALALMGRH